MIYMAMLSRYYDMDMGYGYGDTPIRHFPKTTKRGYIDICVIFIFIEIYNRDKIKTHT